MISVNLKEDVGNSEDPATKLPPEGKYADAKVIFAQERKTKGGEDMILLGFETGFGRCLHSAVIPRVGCRSQEVTEFMFSKIANMFKHLGMPFTGQVNVSEADFLGKTSGIYVFHELFGGVMRAKVKYFFNKAAEEVRAEQETMIEELTDLPF